MTKGKNVGYLSRKPTSNEPESTSEKMVKCKGVCQRQLPWYSFDVDGLCQQCRPGYRKPTPHYGASSDGDWDAE
jgi:hypothetical protein